MKTIKWGLTGIAIILVLAALAAFISDIIFVHQFRKTLSRFHKEGRSTTMAEFRPALVPEHQNAAPLLEKAALVLSNKPVPAAIQELSEFAQEFSKLDSQNRLGLRDLPETRRELLARLIYEPENKALYAILDEAAHKRGYDGHLQYKDTSGSQALPFQVTRQLMGFLILKAEAAAYKGNGREAGQILRDNFRLASLLKHEPSMTQLLSSIACDVIQMNGLYRITNGMDLPADTLQSLETELQDHTDAAPFAHAMDIERIFALEGYQAYLNGISGDFMMAIEASRLPPASAWIYRKSGLMHRDMTVLLTLQAKIQDECRMPSDNIIASIRRNPIEKQIPAFCPLSRLALSRLESIVITKAEYEAWLQVTRVGLALKRYRIAYGGYPDKLTSLAPLILGRVPNDPCGGNSLLYRKEGAGFLLYSVGRDLQDNQGTPINLKFASAPYDIVWKAMR